MEVLARNYSNLRSGIHHESCCRWKPSVGCSRPFSHSWVCYVSLPKLLMRSQLLLPHQSTITQSAPSPAPSLLAELEVDKQTQDLQIQSSTEMNTVHVVFKLQKACPFGKHFFLVGEDSRVGLWDPSLAVPLDWSDGHIWSTEMDIPTGKTFIFKFILKGSTGKVEWQPGPDRTLETWETKHTIVVSEDWENAKFQKITEESLPDLAEISEDLEDVEVQKIEEKILPDKTEFDSAEAILVKTNITDMIVNEEVITLEAVKDSIIIREEQRVLVPGLPPTASHLGSNTDVSTPLTFDEPIESSIPEPVLVPGLPPAASHLGSDTDVSAPLTFDEPIESSIPEKELEQLHKERQPEQSYGNMPEEKADQDCRVPTVTEASDSREEIQSTEKAVDQAPAVGGVFKNDIDGGRKTLFQFILNLGFQKKLLS